MKNMNMIVVLCVILSLIALTVSTVSFYKEDTDNELDDIKLEIEALKDTNREQEAFNNEVVDHMVINTELWEEQIEYNNLNAEMWDIQIEINDLVMILLGI